MLKNKWNIGDIVYLPHPTDPIHIVRGLITGVSVSDGRLAQQYNQGAKLDEYNWEFEYDITYNLLQETHEGFLEFQRYPQMSLFHSREDALVYVYKTAKKVLDLPDEDANTNNTKPE